MTHSIFDPQHAPELARYIDGLLKKISKEHNVVYDDLVETAIRNDSVIEVVKTDMNVDADADVELEMVVINKTKYWYCINTHNVYSYGKDQSFLGTLDENFAIIPAATSALKAKKKKSKPECKPKAVN